METCVYTFFLGEILINVRSLLLSRRGEEKKDDFFTTWNLIHRSLCRLCLTVTATNEIWSVAHDKFGTRNTLLRESFQLPYRFRRASKDAASRLVHRQRRYSCYRDFGACNIVGMP